MMNPLHVVNSRSLAILLTLLSVLAAYGPILAVSGVDGGMVLQVEIVPGRAGKGPLVNRTVITVDYLNEDFAEVTNFLYMTGKGSPQDVFFDPNYQWKEGGGKNDDLPYGVYAFTATYPEPYDDLTTPIKLSIIHYYQDTNFGLVTLQKAKNGDFNHEVYGQEYFIITLTANNRSGSSEAELRFKVLPVNDAPERISDRDFFSIWLNEDGTYSGINKNNDDPKEVFGDKRDPFDVVSYSFSPGNDLARNISVTMNQNGSGVLFQPAPDLCSPYLVLDQRLKGINYGKDWNSYFALFVLNVSDQAGDFITAPLYVYVAPMNDAPVMEALGVVKVREGAICTVQFEATDVDLPYEQELVFGTNATDAIYERSGVQIIYQADYHWKRETGLLRFRTDNSMVGDYPVSAYTRDRSTRDNGAPYDYPNSPNPVYSNFTLSITNENDPPTARIDQPISSFEYNTSYSIEFNASRSSDPDIVHGDVLNYTWLKDGEVFGYGKSFARTITTEGSYNITLNVTDGRLWSLAYVDVIVKKAKVLGEIFEGKDLTRSSEDNSSALVIWQDTQNVKDSRIVWDGQYSMDMTSITGRREGAIYKINVMFAEPLQFLLTDEVRNEPKLEVFLMRPGFVETQLVLSQEDAATKYDFPPIPGSYRYFRMEFDLMGPYTTSSTQTISPRVRLLDNKMGVEITLTIVELDLMDAKPDFELYAIASMKTTIRSSSGVPESIITSWDSSGSGTIPPIVTDPIGPVDDDDDGDGALLVVALVVTFLVVLIIVAVVLFLFLVVFRKKEEPQMTFQPEQTVDEMVFGQTDQYAMRPTGPGYAGAPLPAGGALATQPTVEQVPPPPPVEQLPPAQVVSQEQPQLPEVQQQTPM